MLGGRRFLLTSALATATALLFLSIFYLPFMRLSSLLLIGHGAQEQTIATAMLSLLRTNQIVLGGALLLLAIALPLLKWLYVMALALLALRFNLGPQFAPRAAAAGDFQGRKSIDGEYRRLD